MCVTILDWGCRIVALQVPDKTGKLIDTVLSYSTIEDYKDDEHYVGSTIGRYANRICQGKFKIAQNQIQLTTNENGAGNHLHGGINGFDKRYWTVVNADDSVLEMSIISPDGDEGYPGTLTVYTRYEVCDDNTLTIHYRATANKTTIANITNHSYFNLSNRKHSIDQHQIKVEAQFYTPLDTRNIPVPPFKKVVDSTVFDLREFQQVSQIKKKIGNINYHIEGNGSKQLQTVATIKDKETGRKLVISSDYPSLQVYFGNYLSGKFLPFQGLCCEPHYAPNSPNIEGFPSVILEPDQEYRHTIKYHFEDF